MVKIDLSRTYDFISKDDILSYEPELQRLYKQILEGTGEGRDFLGWTTLPSELKSSNLVDDIKRTAENLRKKSEVFVVIGIGGSYLGARAIIEALSHNFSSYKSKEKDPQVLFAGNQMSEDYLSELLEVLDEKEYSLTVISKSGTTTEPAIAFRIIKQHLEEKYGPEEARERIVAITDKEKGALKQLSDEKGYKTFDVPDDVGGRYSVLTPVGLLPIAVAGIDISKLLEGAHSMQQFSETEKSLMEDPIAKYAVTRNILYKLGKPIEMLVNYQPKLYYFTEWWKQLFGESEGKQQRGIFPAGASFTTDLHSLGQYIQEGLRILFETVVTVEKPHRKLSIPGDTDNLDKLNYLAGKRIEDVNKMAELGTIIAHEEGGVPNMKITIPELNEYYLGQLIYFFEMACALSGYILEINPFNQPGVEAYKKNMFALLGRPGFEEASEEIRKKVNNK